MSSIVDYLGRTVDLLAFQGQKEKGEALLIPALARDQEGGEICTGVQKLAQRWLLEFLTETSTIPYLPARGCDFVAQVRRGELRTTLDAEQAFFLSAKQIEASLTAEEETGIPDDEAFARVNLFAITVVGDLLTLRVEVFSKAGSSRKVIMPIPVKTN